jgi:hypothetical protein
MPGVDVFLLSYFPEDRGLLLSLRNPGEKSIVDPNPELIPGWYSAALCKSLMRNTR